MPTLTLRRRSPSAAVLLALLAVAGLLALVTRELTRARRRARRRTVLSVPDEPDESGVEPSALDRLDATYPDDEAVEDLRERPRPVSSDEAARILGVMPEALTSLNIPVTRAPDGQVAYDSWEIVHWVDFRHADPAGFEARAGAGKS
jgi:hypothetical protein